jgi:hypothetical protein
VDGQELQQEPTDSNSRDPFILLLLLYYAKTVESSETQGTEQWSLGTINNVTLQRDVIVSFILKEMGDETYNASAGSRGRKSS